MASVRQTDFSTFPALGSVQPPRTVGLLVPCPLCGAIKNPGSRTPSRSPGELRQFVRTCLGDHFVVHHVALSTRQRSLLLDEICERLGL